jgi:pimeloyl-ACP methyl ester carboxylesterase
MRAFLRVALLLALLPVGARAQANHLLVITGASGGPEYAQRFHQWATKLVDAAAKTNVTDIAYLSDQPELGGKITGKSSRENVEAAFKSLAANTKPGDAVLVVLIGHGGADGGAARFNLPGPDLMVADYDRLLRLLEGRKVALVNAASASGAFLTPLSAPNRVVVTATRSGFETNETMFGRFFVDAYAGEGADIDKNGSVSLLEAYTYAAREVERWYKEQNRLVTEHAQLDDDGDGKGTPAPDGRAGDGAIAKSFVLGGIPAAVASNPALKALYEEKRELEARVETLRGMKAKMDAATYEKELEKLLVDLALKNQAIKKLEGGK